jgi:hypothetical protein
MHDVSAMAGWAASFASGEGYFVTRWIRLEDRRLTPVPSGHVVSEAAEPRGRPVWVELKLNSLSADSALPATRSGPAWTGQQQDLIAEGFAFLLPSVLVYPSVRRGLSVPGTGTASPRRAVRPPR